MDEAGVREPALRMRRITAPQRLASLKLTLVGMAALAAGVLTSYRRADAEAAWVVAPLALLAVNLLAAIATHPRFRQQPALLGFHLCLLAVIVLAAAGRLMRLDARVEIAEGQAFSAAEVMTVSRGPWHRWRLDRAAFVQGPVSVDYLPGLVRGHTYSRVQVADAAGTPATVIVGDDKPLVVAGYRFYTTPNKGYALLLTWLQPGAEPRTGAIHLPSYPMLDWKQESRWTTPAGEGL